MREIVTSPHSTDEVTESHLLSDQRSHSSPVEKLSFESRSFQLQSLCFLFYCMLLLIIYFPVMGGCWSCFWYFAIIKNAIMNIFLHMVFPFYFLDPHIGNYWWKIIFVCIWESSIHLLYSSNDTIKSNTIC